MAQARDFSRDLVQDRGIGRARRFSLVRRAGPAARRPPFVRSDVQRGPQLSMRMWLPAGIRPLSATAYEKLMTQRLQGAIVAAMLGLSLFFHTPLTAAVAGLLP